MVGDEDGYSARGGDFAAAREYLSALCLRSLGERLAQEMGARRRDRRPLRGRYRLRLPASRRKQTVFWKNFRERLEKFGLELHPEKTRRIEFGRFAEPNRKRRGEGKPETFDFLGFTHISGKKSKGHFTVRRKTIRKRMRRKLQDRLSSNSASACTIGCPKPVNG